MTGKDKGRRIQNSSFGLDAMHIVIGAAVVVLAVISFIDPDGNMALFPLIFLLAAVLNLVTGHYRLGRSGRDKKRRLSAVLQMFFGLLLLVLCIISAVSIWWR